MNYSFNLVTQPWIPCISGSGQVAEWSISQLFEKSSDLSSIVADTPLETAAIYRLLMAILHSALVGPSNPRRWHQIWLSGNFNSTQVQEYLENWRDRFDLFDPSRPFFQSRDERVKPKSVISLAFEMASGNNASLFDHHIEETGAAIPPAKAARALLAIQAFGLAGLSGLDQKFTDAPWGRGIIFLFEGRNLFETLLLNLATGMFQQRLPVTGQDLPAWENQDPFTPDRQIPFGYLDYLTWQGRRILLIPEGSPDYPLVREFSIAPAMRLNSEVLDPMKHYRLDDKYGNLVLRFSEGRSLWRDSAALLSLHSPVKTRPPENFTAIASLVSDYGYLPASSILRVMALGMANNQAKVEFLRHEQLILPLDYFQNEDLVGILSAGLSMVEKTYQGLQLAVKTFAVWIISPKSAGKSWRDIDRVSKEQADNLLFHWGLDRLFWSELEFPFTRFLLDLPGDQNQVQTIWVEDVRQTAWKTFDQIVELAGQTSNSIKSEVNARGLLAGYLHDIFDGKEKEQAL